MKRILLFVLTNLGVMLVLGLVVNVLGLNRFLSANGLNLTSLLGFSLVMGSFALPLTTITLILLAWRHWHKGRS